MRRHLTYANVMSTLCLFILLGGSAYAATKVGSKQIADNSVQGKDIKNGSITGKDVKKASLTSGLFASGQLPRGATGAAGPTGATGPQGSPGASASAAYASVNSNGTVAYGKQVTTANRYAGRTGEYVVEFDRPVANCAFVGTQGYGSPGTGPTTAGATVVVNVFSNDAVYVQTTTANGTPADESFFVALLC